MVSAKFSKNRGKRGMTLLFREKKKIETWRWMPVGGRRIILNPGKRGKGER